MLGPPEDVEAAALFLLLLQSPRPRWKVGERYAVALTALERAGIEQTVSSMSPQAASLARSRHEVALCLHDKSGPLFADAADVGGMKVAELQRLVADVRNGLRVCCPEYGFCSAMAWHQRLLTGARLTPGIAGMIGSCLDEGMTRTISRPDRWFGLPMSELTDGHWMAYRAGRAYVEEQRKQDA